MNTAIAEISKRPAILVLWWLKARRAASGHNNAAVRSTRYDRWFTISNLLLPITVFALGVCNSVASDFNGIFSIEFSDLILLATSLLLGLSALQFAGDYKVKALEYRKVGNDYDAIAQMIEATGFVVDDDVAFADIANQFEQVRLGARHVPERDWLPAKDRFDGDIAEARVNILDHVNNKSLTNSKLALTSG